MDQANVNLLIGVAFFSFLFGFAAAVHVIELYLDYLTKHPKEAPKQGEGVNRLGTAAEIDASILEPLSTGKKGAARCHELH